MKREPRKKTILLTLAGLAIAASVWLLVGRVAETARNRTESLPTGATNEIEAPTGLPPGKELFVRRFVGRGRHFPQRIAAGPAGNIYALSAAEGYGTGMDYLVLKYDKDGNRQWVRRYNGPGGGKPRDEPTAMAIDSQGNVAVTGRSRPQGRSTYDYDIATVKWSTSGRRLWVRRNRGPGGGTSNMDPALVIDDVGNIYVAGGLGDRKGSSLVIKYSRTGAKVWERPFRAGGRAMSLALDSGNNLLTAHDRYGGLNYVRTRISKYSPSGRLLWKRTVKGKDLVIAWGSPKLAVDADDNIVIAEAFSDGAGNPQAVHIAKYDRQGSLLWSKQWKRGYAPEPGYSVATAGMDARGAVYVAGSFTAQLQGPNLYALKYSPTGRRLWLRTYDGPGRESETSRPPMGGLDSFPAATFDGSGDLIAAGSVFDGPERFINMVTIKYGAAGQKKWLRTFARPGNSAESAFDVTVDRAGYVYVLGGTPRYSPEDWSSPDLVIIKYSP